MKTREGFVSNSSSSSFVLSLKDMSHEQKEEIKEIVNRCNQESNEGWLNVTSGFIFGTVDNENIEELADLMSKNNLKNKIDYAWGD